MSFSSQVKEELIQKMARQRHCRIAELAAIVQFGCKVEDVEEGRRILFTEESESLAQKYFTLLKKTITINQCDKVDACLDAYSIEGELANSLVELLRLDTHPDGRVDGLLLQQPCCKRAFIRGAYLCSGSMSDPNKAYHFEIVCKDRAQADQLSYVMNSFQVDSKIIERKGHFVVYLKEGAQIADILSVMEAGLSLMEFENIRILKEMRNSVNRKVNCETANIGKTVSAAVRQVEDILYIEETVGLSTLSASLQEMAYLRLENQESSLIDLGQMLEPAVGKSGVNHRLRKISEIADKLREQEKLGGNS